MGTTLRLTAFIILAFVFCGTNAQAGDTLRDDLAYVPADAVLLAGFVPWSEGDAAALLRSEVLEATGLAERLRAAADVLAGARRVLLFSVPTTSEGRRSFVGVVRREGAPPSATSDLALERVDAATWLVGDPAEVRRALARHRNESSGPSGPSPRWTEIVDAADGATAWGWLTPAGACDGGSCVRGDATAARGTFTRGLAGLEWWSFSLKAADRPLILRTRVRDEDDADVLADGLRGFLATQRFDARREPEELRTPLEEARVGVSGPLVTLDLPSTEPLLGRLCRKDGCDAPLRRLLTWRLGVEEREARERVGELLRRLRLVPGERVADVGSGLGFYTTRLARVVGPNGRAIAVEIDEDMVAELRKRTADGWPQMEAILGAADDPRLAAESLDAVLIVNAYHEMTEHRRMLEHIKRALRPGGRLMLVEPFSRSQRGEPRGVQEREHVLAPELAEQDLRDAGFRVVECDETFVVGSDSDHGLWLTLAERP